MSLVASAQLQLRSQISPQQRQALAWLRLPLSELHSTVAAEVAANPLLDWLEPETALATTDQSRRPSTQPNQSEFDTGSAGYDLDSAHTAHSEPMDGAASEGSRAEYLQGLPLARFSFEAGSSESEQWDEMLDMVSPSSLREHLQQQVTEHHLPPELAFAVTCLIDCLDEQGFLPEALAQLQAHLQQALAPLMATAAIDHSIIDSELWTRALTILQGFDPCGVGAESIQQNWALQLNQLQQIAQQSTSSEAFEAAASTHKNQSAEFIQQQQIAQLQIEQLQIEQLQTVVRDHFADLMARRERLIMRRIGVSEQQWRALKSILARLRRYPAQDFTAAAAPISPDFWVQQTPSGWRVALCHERIPQLRLQAWDEADGGSVGATAALKRNAQWRDYWQSGKAVMGQLQFYFSTVHQVASAVVSWQSDYFMQGRAALKPLTLKQIAQQLQLHESTVSRAVSGKYLYSVQGMIALSELFTGALTQADGVEIAVTQIHSALQQLIASEDQQRPFSDQELTAALAAQGIKVARRTVTKYRQRLGIGSQMDRKK